MEKVPPPSTVDRFDREHEPNDEARSTTPVGMPDTAEDARKRLGALGAAPTGSNAK